MIKVFAWLKSTATTIFLGPFFQHQPLHREKRDANITKHWSVKKGLITDYEKTDLFKVRVIFLFTLFNNTYEEPEQSITQSFTSRPKCRHSKIFMKLFIVSANPVQTEDSEAYIWPLLPPKLVFHLTILKGHVIISVSCPSYKIYQVVNPDSRR